MVQVVDEWVLTGLVERYMAGSLFFANNLATLAQRTRRRCIAVDWLGCGASSRPDYAPRNHGEALDFFVDSFEAWRVERGLEAFDLVAHSLGVGFV